MKTSPNSHSERDARAARRNKLRETAPSLNSNQNQSCDKIDVPRREEVVSKIIKSDSEPVAYDDNFSPDSSAARVKIPHSLESSTHEPPPFGGGAPENPSFSLKHPARESNLTDFTKTQKQRINFPPVSSKVWKDVDMRLRLHLRTTFYPQYISASSTNILATEFDDVVHEFFLKEFGPLESKPASKRQQGPRPHRGLVRLRQQKKEVKTARKLLRKQGNQDTEAYATLSKRWLELVRAHNRLRIEVTKRNKKRNEISARRRFKKDPHAFANGLFKGNDSKRGTPSFSEKKATNYFSSTYRDLGRDTPVNPLPEMKRPAIPEFLFSKRCPTLKDLNKSVRHKRNGAAAGLNALTYVPYKTCSSLLETLHLIVKKIWRTKDIPDDWAVAFIVLLAKSDVLDDPAEFRPIAITNTVGKIFFSILSDRLQRFLVANRYINKEIQKGFLTGVPGCLEHSFTLYEALKNASMAQRQIVVSWIDLANAYGSVRHNLIQFALNWYHVPDFVQIMIFNYYEKLMAKVQTRSWSTGFFLFDIGLFQGCVLSTILFDCVFQLLLDMLAPHSELGYTFKRDPVTVLHKAYADDLVITTSTPGGNQKCLNTCDKFLVWTCTMKAKPRKCISLALRQFDPRYDSGKFKPLTDKIYSAFDPGLTIANEPIGSIFNPKYGLESLLRDHFKFLGRWISMDLNEEKIKTAMRSKFFADMDLVEKCGVNGLMKLWLYQHYVIPRLAWPFIVYDFSRSFSIDLEKRISMQLKRWAGLYRGADSGCLFRIRKDFGLQLTSISEYFEKMQLIKCDLLESSSDPVVRELYKLRAERMSKFNKRWVPSKAKRIVSLEADISLRSQTQEGRGCMGSGNFISVPSTADRRAKVLDCAAAINGEKRLAHAVGLARQGVWVDWREKCTPFDLSWQNLIYGPGPRVIAFVLNSLINSVSTPDMLKLWGYTKHASCRLCNHSNCTLHHILANCDFSLNQDRYTWRHDSVLKTIELDLTDFVSNHNKTHVPKAPAPTQQPFVKSGDKKSSGLGKQSTSKSILHGATDWKLIVDYKTTPIVFPPEILASGLRPDIVLWSVSLTTVFMIELTCPAEEGIEAAQVRKQTRYLGLSEEIKNVKWRSQLITIEIGARGLVPTSFRSLLKKLGYGQRKTSSLCKAVSVVSARCSYAIYLMRNSEAWDRGRELVTITNVKESHVVENESAVSIPAHNSKLVDRQTTLNLLRYHGIHKLYHFTDESNLPSIERNGLLSRHEIEQRNLTAVLGNDQPPRDADKCKNLHDFVRLSFVPNHPILYQCIADGRIVNPVVLEIDVEACSIPGTLFSSCNANRHDAFISHSAEVIRFDVISKPNHFIPNVLPSDKHFYQAEILIKSNLPTKFIDLFKGKQATNPHTTNVQLESQQPKWESNLVGPPVKQHNRGPLTRSMIRPPKRKVKYQSTLPTIPEEMLERRGLRNLGNTCYFGAIIHALAHAWTFPRTECTQPLLCDLLNWVKSSSTIPTGEADSEIDQTVLKVIRSFKNENFVEEFPIGTQHCAKELLSKVLDRNGTPSGIEFSGKIQNILECPNPGCTVRAVEEPFLLLELPLPPAGKCAPARLSLASCLLRYFETERLRKDELFNCPHCSSNRLGQTTKRVVSQPGQGLIISLTRCKSDNLKDKTEVHYPLRGLDISEITFPPVTEKFDLQAVVLHSTSGQLATQGHYKAACLDKANLSWHMFDDGHLVVPLSDTDPVLSGNGEEFILFYKRRDDVR